MARFSIADVAFEVGPECELDPRETACLAEVADSGEDVEHLQPDPIRLHVVERSRAVRRAVGAISPAAVRCTDGVLAVDHEAFSVEIDMTTRNGRLLRDSRDSFPLSVASRVALCSFLPFHGGVPLHAAGIIVNGTAIACFGPSGAGKSTLAGCLPFPVVSDELVVVRPEPAVLESAGFFSNSRAGAQRHALVALMQLHKGPRFELARLEPTAALRSMLSAVMVPMAAALWSRCMPLLVRLSKEVPVYRMAWSPDHPPWRELAALADAGQEGTSCGTQ